MNRSLLAAVAIGSLGVALPYLYAARKAEERQSQAEREYRGNIKLFCEDSLNDANKLASCIVAFDAWRKCRSQAEDAVAVGLSCDHGEYQFETKRQQVVNRILN